ncbi:MAG: GtrA family protein [Chitinophagaceae bacterium]|uniref:GtrA/DPMS transmembrane domain-containing protein n=1 Tax=Rurimicrobium arvi TaxID=2049916 RepID=A0ABP8ML45_9BACT
MTTFFRAQASSIIATLVDFTTTIVLKELFGLWYVLANITGVTCGGVTNFLINKDWVFNESKRGVHVQAGRYFLIWSGNFLLNAGGVWLLTQSSDLGYLHAKMIVSLILAFTYNFFLQKHFVFK